MTKGLVIAAVQSSSVKGAIAENVRRHVRLAELARQHGADLALFPELSLSGYEPTIAAEVAIEPTDRAVLPLAKLADDAGLVILAGCPLLSGSPKPYLGMLIFQPGAAVSTYRKRFVHTSEEPYFTASNDSVVLTVGGVRIGVAICFDIKNPAQAADAAAQGAEVYAAGVAKTPGEMIEAAENMHERAQRYGMLAVLANHAAPTGGWEMGGHSAVWNADGRLLAHAPAQGESIVLAERGPQGWAARVV